MQLRIADIWSGVAPLLVSTESPLRRMQEANALHFAKDAPLHGWNSLGVRGEKWGWDMLACAQVERSARIRGPITDQSGDRLRGIRGPKTVNPGM